MFQKRSFSNRLLFRNIENSPNHVIINPSMKVCQPSENLTSLKKLILQLQLTIELSQIQEIASIYNDLLILFAEYSFVFENNSEERQSLKSTCTKSEGSLSTQDPARDGYNWYGYCGQNPLSFVDLNGLEAKDVGFIIYRDNNSKLSVSDKSYRGLDRIYFYNSKTGEKFNLYHAQTYVSHSDYPEENTLEAFMGGFSIQYLGNVTESGQVLYNKESSKYKGPVFNVQNANTKGLGLTNEQGQIIGDPDTTPIRVHSNWNVNTNQEVNMASGGCPMYDYEQADDFAAFLERSGVKPGDTINGYIKENFEP